MKIENNGSVMFELKGTSLLAAQRLEREVLKELETVKPKSTGYLNEIQDSWNSFYDGLIRRLSAEAPEVLALTGLNAATIQVMGGGKDALPRAYREFPQIYLSPEEPPRYFMGVPVDYQGNFFRPQDAQLLDNAETERAADLLFAGGWLGNAPLVTRKKEGVATPADYAPAKPSFHSAARRDTFTQRVFIAGGDSLKAVEDYERRKAAYEAAMSRAQSAVKTIAEMEFPKLLESLPEGEGLRASAGATYGGYMKGKTVITLSVRMQGRENPWNAGKTVPLADNEAYTLQPRHGGEYTVTPRRDTHAGRALAAIFDAIPKTPDLSEYPTLLADFTFYPNQFEAAFGMNDRTPHIRKFGGRTLLVYNSDESETGDFTPPGATPMPLKAFKWLEADEQDRNMGVTPPPMPQEISTQLTAWPRKPLRPDNTSGPQP